MVPVTSIQVPTVLVTSKGPTGSVCVGELTTPMGIKTEAAGVLLGEVPSTELGDEPTPSMAIPLTEALVSWIGCVLR